jgi:hypothetical protein
MNKTLLLSRLQSWSNLEIQINENEAQIINDVIKQDPVTNTTGYCDIINNDLIAIFSRLNKNFLCLQEKVFELTPDFDVQFQVAQSETEESWFKIYRGKELVYEQKYINPHPPFVLPDPFEYDPDFNTTNFAYHLAQYIQKVKDHPGIVLFENAENG